MGNNFVMDRQSILENERTRFIDDVIDIQGFLDNIEKFINICYQETGYEPLQSGRVIALRATDIERLSSAFKSAIYLGKYDNMDNTSRFLRKMVAAGHSYEPIRGESILFLFVGVGKPVYDHLTTYSVGRTTRIAGGQRANLPWGFEVPFETKDVEGAFDRNIPRIKEVARLAGMIKEDAPEQKEMMQAARSELPVGYIMPPFVLEFSEEALIKNIFAQRIFEPGAQGATVEVVKSMWELVTLIDAEKWKTLYDHHGPHISAWERSMRAIRDKNLSLGGLLDLAQEKGIINLDCEYNLDELPLYDMIMGTLGRQVISMWDKA
jgi:hypothetical protein